MDTSSAPRLRRSLLLPNARVRATASPARGLGRTGERTEPNQPQRGGNHIARRLAALESPGDAVRRLPVGAPAVVLAGRPPASVPVAAAATVRAAAAATERLVRRSIALAAAPVPAAAPGRVLPGRRAAAGDTSTRLVARSSSASTATPTSTAARLRELVATGAFEAPGTARVPVAPPAGATAGTPVLRTAAERFEQVQRTARVADRPVVLPQRFRPLAERIVGPRIAVRVVHGAVTRKALAAAGHDAATTDRTIHLPARPDASARTMSVVAHELEHVAAPSAIPRFHGGVASPEETRATRTEQIVARLARSVDERGGSAASAGIAGLPVGGLTAFGRSGAGAGAAGPAVPASADPPRASTSSSSTSSTVRRSPSTSTSGGSSTSSSSPATGAGGSDQPVRRSPQPGRIIPNQDESSGSDQAPALSPAQLSAIIRAVEDRLLEEIERRGGLSRGAF
jgi:hypothetical protein